MSQHSNNVKPIPQPKPDFLLGNLKEIDPEHAILSMMHLADTYGPIFRLQFPGTAFIVVSSFELVDELCDEVRFDKRVSTPLKFLREVANGLFTADTADPLWGIAHRILMPCFGPIAINGMFDKMMDIADQLTRKIEYFGSSWVIDVTDVFTRLTLDTIALCAFNYRFNSYYQKEMHPFVNAMVGVLLEGQQRSRHTALVTTLMLGAKKKLEADTKYMRNMVDELITIRKANPPPANHNPDLLDNMLNGKDPVTGRGLTEENIRAQMITFLIAGHETTSGLLSFTICLLLKNPEVLKKARDEVDRVLGNDRLKLEHIKHLKYLDMTLRESIRLWPTAPAISLGGYNDEVIGKTNKYEIKKEETMLILIPKLHRDPAVWGNDVEEFKPERFENLEKIPKNAWKPFGNGSNRSCIGRGFAWQESLIVLALLLQKFDLREHDPNYTLKIKQTLTIKPTGFYIHASLRKKSTLSAMQNLSIESKPQNVPQQPTVAQSSSSSSGVSSSNQEKGILILYGSNSGSSEAFAKKIATQALVQGYKATITTLDSNVGTLPHLIPVVIVTASYEGKPTDNAKLFVSWIETLTGGSLKGVNYTVFGCGHRDWQKTYQAIPKKIDAKLEEAGAHRFYARGETDASGDFFGAFDDWFAGLWNALKTVYGEKETVVSNLAFTQSNSVDVQIVSQTRTTILKQSDLTSGTVVENYSLIQSPSETESNKHHIEITLPEDVTYRVGDYLVVLPVNPAYYVNRILRYFNLNNESQFIISSNTEVFSFPTNYPINAHEFFSNYVELSQVVTKKQVALLEELSEDPKEKEELHKLVLNYENEIVVKRASLIDLLDTFRSVKISLGQVITLLPSMRIRQYSISSSPLWKPNHVTISISVLLSQAWFGKGEFRGVASNFLANVAPGDLLSVSIRPSSGHFHLPAELETPIIMICAGTGIAPFRGFIQERAIQAESGRKLGKALLFFGTQTPETFLYKKEMTEWEKLGVVSVRVAYSRKPEGDIKYVQHLLWRDKEELIEMFKAGARFYVCGSGKKMAPDVRKTILDIYIQHTSSSVEAAELWLASMESNRYATDVFG